MAQERGQNADIVGGGGGGGGGGEGGGGGGDDPNRFLVRPIAVNAVVVVAGTKAARLAERRGWIRRRAAVVVEMAVAPIAANAVVVMAGTKAARLTARRGWIRRRASGGGGGDGCRGGDVVGGDDVRWQSKL